jgi:hypothetical protein
MTFTVKRTLAAALALLMHIAMNRAFAQNSRLMFWMGASATYSRMFLPANMR